MNNALDSGRKSRIFNIIENFNREALDIEVDQSLKTTIVIYVLNRLINKHKKPD